MTWSVILLQSVTAAMIQVNVNTQDTVLKLLFDQVPYPTKCYKCSLVYQSGLSLIKGCNPIYHLFDSSLGLSALDGLSYKARTYVTNVKIDTWLKT